jgi:hypothetical protein
VVERADATPDDRRIWRARRLAVLRRLRKTEDNEKAHRFRSSKEFLALLQHRKLSHREDFTTLLDDTYILSARDCFTI